MPDSHIAAVTSPQPAVPPLQELQARLHRAETDRDAWRAAGVLEKYLESCSRVDALERQLGLMRPTAGAL